MAVKPCKVLSYSNSCGDVEDNMVPAAGYKDNLAFLLMIYPVFAWIDITRSTFALIVGMTLLNGVCKTDALRRSMRPQFWER
mgnify:CR=1 FL=1